MDYKTTQRAYSNPIVWIAILFSGVAVALGWILDDGSDGTDATLTAVILGLTAALLLGVLIMPLTQTVTATEVRSRLAGITLRRVPLSEIASVVVRDYHPLRQFGGWGLRFGLRRSRAYTMAGNRAAVLTLKDGRDVYLGARDVDELAQAIETARAMVR